MNFSRLSCSSFVVAGTLALCGGLARAGDLPATQVRTAAAVASGFGSSGPMPALTRGAPGKAPSAVLNTLVGIVCPLPCGKLTTTSMSDRLRATADQWRVDVFGDGSGAEFYDQSVANRAHAQGVDPSQKWSDSALESAGRTLIAQHFADVLQLGAGETIAPESTSFRREWGQDVGGTQTSKVVANRITFTRLINGVPVVGNGSKFVATFLNDGTLESFRYDWPSYTATATAQTPIGASGILSRVQQVLLARTGTAPNGAVQVAGSTATLGSNFALERLECGYYDPGAPVGDPTAPIQPGCYYNATDRQVVGGASTRAGYSGAVPAFNAILADAKWPEARLLLGLSTVGAPPAPNSGP